LCFAGAVFRRQKDEGNPLEAYFRANGDGLLIHKWLHYFDIYDRHFAPFRGRDITVVEFGVYQGGSLQMWRDYFGAKARIVGVDIDERCKALPVDAEVVIGDQADPVFHCELRALIGEADVIIEDGGHTMAQQLTTFAEMWPTVRDGGVYLVEDLHTSYWSTFGGGYRKSGTFIEHAKGLIDSLNAWHSLDHESFTVDDHTRTIRGMHVYDSVIVFDKGVVVEPSNERIGRATIDW
jgi:23S rRNA U2552 (ribose-2'-O)-methylase RlmE/FtsJ